MEGYDFDSIAINPSIQTRIDRMRRRQAEERADRDAALAMEAVRGKNKAIAEAEMLKKSNQTLMQQLHAAMGWPVRLMLPVPGGR